MRAVTATTLTMLTMVVSLIEAHPQMWPRESTLGSAQRYTLYLPAGPNLNEQVTGKGEGAKPHGNTTSVVLEVPNEVLIWYVGAPGPGWTYELKKEGARIASITFKMNLRPGEFIEVPLYVNNPATGTELVWKMHQGYADGHVDHWVGPRGSENRAMFVKLVPPGTTSRE